MGFGDEMRLPPASLVAIWLRLSVVIMAALWLNACGTPGGAPVVTRQPTPLKPLHPVAYHIVNPGDTLYAIAWRAGVDYKKLAEWNQIQYPYTIYSGKRLRLNPLVKVQHKTASATIKNGKSVKRQKTSIASQKLKKRSIKPSRLQRSAAKNSKRLRSLELDRKLKWQWPTNGIVMQGFSGRDPARKGLKISGHVGQSIRAAESGQVVYSGNGLIGYGALIIIKHDSNYLSAYGHNRKLLVVEGDAVAKGQQIAEMGHAANGKFLLHFEIRRRGKPVNPIRLLPKRR